MQECNSSADEKREGTQERGGQAKAPNVRPSSFPDLRSSLLFPKRKNSPPINPMKTSTLIILIAVILSSCQSMAPVRASFGYNDAKSGMTYEIVVRPTK